MDKIWKKLKEWFGKDRMSHATVTALVIGIIVVLNVIVYTLTTTLNWYAYADSTKNVTVSDVAASAFADAVKNEKTLKVVFCQSRDSVEASTTGRYVLTTAELFAEKLPTDFYSVAFENIIAEPNLLVEKYGFSEEETKNVFLKKTSVVFIGEDIQGNKRFRVLTDTQTSAGYIDFYDYNSSGSSLNAYIGEEMFTSMGLWVLNNTAKEPKVAYVTKYHGETVTKSMTLLLLEAGYSIREIDLRQKNIDFTNVGLVVISNPQTDFERGAEGVDSEMKRLEQYMEQGGLVYLSLDPYSQAKMPNLLGLMADFGIEERTALTEDGTTVCQIVKDRDNGITTDGFSIVGSYENGNEVASAIAEKTKSVNEGGVLLAYASALNLTKPGAKALLVSSTTSVTEADGKTVDKAGSYPLVAYAEKTYLTGKSGKLIVSGSIYLTASDAVISDSYANKDYLFATLETLGDLEGSMPYGCKPMLVTETTLNNLTMKTARAITVCLMMVPLALGVLGCVVLVRRKNR